MAGTKVSDVYAATSVEEQEKNYDEWATEYEKDLCAMGYRMPMMIASVFVRYVKAGAGPILDVGCGGGIQAEPLHALGYAPLIGMDLSQGMLDFAANKNLYDELVRAKLGDQLEFEDNHFAAILSSGTFTSGHAPAESFRELVRIAQAGAPIIVSLRQDEGRDRSFEKVIEQLEQEGKWSFTFKTPPFYSMPYGEPDVLHEIKVYTVS